MPEEGLLRSLLYNKSINEMANKRDSILRDTPVTLDEVYGGLRAIPGTGDLLSGGEGITGLGQALGYGLAGSAEKAKGALFKGLTSGMDAMLLGVPAIAGSILTKAAKGADLGALVRAEEMVKAGSSLGDARKATNWQLPTGQPQHPSIPFYEVSDQGMFIQKGLPQDLTPLKDRISHPVLFNSVEGLGDVPFREMTRRDHLEYGIPESSRGSYVPKQTTPEGRDMAEQIWASPITYNRFPRTQRDSADNVFHEITHAANQRLGLSGPGRTVPQTRQEWLSYAADPDELAARAATIRRLWSPEKRAATPFLETVDEVHTALVTKYNKMWDEMELAKDLQSLEHPVSPIAGVVK